MASLYCPISIILFSQLQALAISSSILSIFYLILAFSKAIGSYEFGVIAPFISEISLSSLM
jgi:hypothetical protein